MKKGNPEHKMQVRIRGYLMRSLPQSIEWTASLTGTYLSPAARSRAKAAGVRPGFPDLQFLFPDGVTRYIELKTPEGSLSPEQRAFRDRCQGIRPPVEIWGLARSCEDVAALLASWGAELRNDILEPEASARAREALHARREVRAA